MARWRRGTTEETAAVPGQRSEPALPPDAGRDDTGPDLTGQEPGDLGEGQAREADGPPAEPVAPTARTPAAEPEPEAERTAPDAERPAPEAEPPKPGKPADHKIRHTRLSGTWAAVVGFTVVLLLLLIFILQNLSTVEVSYFGAHGHLPLGVGLLLAAVAGILLVALAGSARIMQLRATARKHRRADARAIKAEAREARAAAKTRP